MYVEFINFEGKQMLLLDVKRACVVVDFMRNVNQVLQIW